MKVVVLPMTSSMLVMPGKDKFEEIGGRESQEHSKCGQLYYSISEVKRKWKCRKGERRKGGKRRMRGGGQWAHLGGWNNSRKMDIKGNLYQGSQRISKNIFDPQF